MTSRVIERQDFTPAGFKWLGLTRIQVPLLLMSGNYPEDIVESYEFHAVPVLFFCDVNPACAIEQLLGN